jgi:hypothetical protein
MSALRRPPVESGSPSVALDTTPRRGRRPSRDSVLRAGRLAGLEAVDLAARYGTPMYVYDLDLVERRGNELRRALPERVDIAYAVKANPALAIVSFVN